MILRAVGAPGIDFSAFQDDFDLDKNRLPHEPPRNNFESVAAVVRAKYPLVNFEWTSFPKGDGAKKLAFVEGHLQKQRPLLLSLALAPFGGNGWHIMPVVDMDQDKLTLLRFVNANGMVDLQHVNKNDLVSIHDSFDGGHEVAYLRE